MDDLYKEYILEHYRHPRHHGTLEGADVSHEDDNPLCGDRIRIDLRVKDDAVDEIRFSGRGCAISQASTSMLTEQVEEKKLHEVMELTREDVLGNLGIAVSAARIKCALLGWTVLRGAVLKLRHQEQGHAVPVEAGGTSHGS